MELRQAVEQVTLPFKCGCRLVCDGAFSVCVYDLHRCPVLRVFCEIGTDGARRWTHQQMFLLLFLCPGARMSVQASAQSLSGFVLIFEVQRRTRLGLRLALAGACAGLCLALWGWRQFGGSLQAYG
jgi:hypothetical protein